MVDQAKFKMKNNTPKIARFSTNIKSDKHIKICISQYVKVFILIF
jgi:hypothetical protein